MLQPLSHERCMAEIRFFVDGELVPETQPIPFVFDPAHMEAEPAVPVAETPAPEPIPPEMPAAAIDRPALPPSYRSRTVAEPEPEPDASAAERPDAPHGAAGEIGLAAQPRLDPEVVRPRARWWLPLAICLLAGVIGAAGYEVWSVVRQPRWVELHLDARPVGRQIRVTWDGNAAGSTGAARALLAMTDGGEHHDIELTQSQLRAGVFTYAPAHSDVAIRLILYAKGLGVTGDAVRFEMAPAPCGQRRRARGARGRGECRPGECSGSKPSRARCRAPGGRGRRGKARSSALLYTRGATLRAGRHPGANRERHRDSGAGSRGRTRQGGACVGRAVRLRRLTPLPCGSSREGGAALAIQACPVAPRRAGGIGENP